MVSAAPPLAEVLPASWASRTAACSLRTTRRSTWASCAAACGACGLPWPEFAVLDTVPVARRALVAG